MLLFAAKACTMLKSKHIKWYLEMSMLEKTYFLCALHIILGVKPLHDVYRSEV
jgi:hypothetical protein